ncbi:MAG: tRNA modification GTPase [Phycisphaerae bacterium]
MNCVGLACRLFRTAMLDRLDETIVAVSSAPGFGTLGIVRLSGPQALTIADRLIRCEPGRRPTDQPGAVRCAAEVFVDADLSLPAHLYIFRRPHSYTREDLVEIHTIGSPPALELVLARAVDLGAVVAQGGEFTARAFLNGAMGLTEAAGVAGLIRAQSDAQLRASRRLVDGALARAITEARDRLAELLALVEAGIDFVEEPIEFITPGTLRTELEGLAAHLGGVLSGAVPEETLDMLPHILLFGPPNAGKSSLMNRLSGTKRAICAAAAGTTRDILSAPMNLRRGDAILLDTAGIDRSMDEVVARAREMTLSAAGAVDLICLVMDVAAPPDDHIVSLLGSLNVAKVVVAANKCDLLASGDADSRLQHLERWGLGPVCLVSALHGIGVDALRSAFAESLESETATPLSEALLLTQRQRRAVQDAMQAIDRAIALTDATAHTGDCADILALELREAADALGSIAGPVTTEELLTHVFANFCIGK